MFSVSLSTLSTERERREGGGSLFLPGRSLSVATAAHEQSPEKTKGCANHISSDSFLTRPDLLLSDQMMNCILQSVRILNVYLTNFLWWGGKNKKNPAKSLLHYCFPAVLGNSRCSRRTFGNRHRDEKNARAAALRMQAHNARAKIMWSVPVPLFMLVSVYKYIYISVLCFHFIMFLQMFLSGLTVAMIWS